MNYNGLFVCEEDNIFDELSALYEDVQISPYSDAPGLDIGLAWEGEEIEIDEEDLLDEFTEGFRDSNLDFQEGDILIANVYQTNPETRNLEHAFRPFLVTSANAINTYGFQLTTSWPVSLRNYIIRIKDYKGCGLTCQGNFALNEIKKVSNEFITKRVGHITNIDKQSILYKLFDIKKNANGKYKNHGFGDKLDRTINCVKRIKC